MGAAKTSTPAPDSFGLSARIGVAYDELVGPWAVDTRDGLRPVTGMPLTPVKAENPRSTIAGLPLATNVPASRSAEDEPVIATPGVTLAGAAPTVPKFGRNAAPGPVRIDAADR